MQWPCTWKRGQKRNKIQQRWIGDQTAVAATPWFSFVSSKHKIEIASLHSVVGCLWGGVAVWRGRLYLATAPIGSLTGAGFRFGSTTGYESYAQALRSTQLHSVLRGHLFESQHGQTIRAVEGSVVK